MTYQYYESIHLWMHMFCMCTNRVPVATGHMQIILNFIEVELNSIGYCSTKMSVCVCV